MATKLKGSLAFHVLTNSIVDALVSFIKALPNYIELKNDFELLLNLTKQVDKLIASDKSLSKKQKEQINKVEIIVDALTKAFQLVDEEIPTVKQKIEFFINNHLIKSNSLKKSLSSVVKGLAKLL